MWSHICFIFYESRFANHTIVRDLQGPSKNDYNHNHIRVGNNSESTQIVSQVQQQPECFLPKASWIGNHPSVTFISTQRSAAFWLLPAIPTLVHPSTPGNCYLSRSFRYQSSPRHNIKIAFLRLLEGGGDEYKSGTSATYPWSSVLSLFLRFSSPE